MLKLKNDNLAALERVARYMAGQDTPIIKWLTRGQAFVLRGYLERAGFVGGQLWGSSGMRRTVFFASPVCNLSISPLNQAGNFCYFGSIEYREAMDKKEADRRAEIEKALNAAKSNEKAQLEESLSQIKADKDKFTSGDYEAVVHMLEFQLSLIKSKESPHVENE